LAAAKRIKRAQRSSHVSRFGIFGAQNPCLLCQFPFLARSISKGPLHMAQYRSALLQLRIPGIPVGSRQGLSPAPFPLIGVLAVPLLCPDDSLESGPGETVHADLVDDALQGSRQVLPHRCYPIYLICTAFTPPTPLLSGANNCVSMSARAKPRMWLTMIRQEILPVSTCGRDADFM
jgi:hypothetical protein